MKIKLSQLVDKWTPGTVFLYCNIQLLIRIYKLFEPLKYDGWRMTTQLHHRKEESKYIGTLHGLKLKDQNILDKNSCRKNIIDAIYCSMKQYPAVQYYLSPHTFGTCRKHSNIIDIAVIVRDAQNRLQTIDVYPDKEYALQLSAEKLVEIIKQVIDAYNMYYLRSDNTRPLLITKLLKRKCSHSDFLVALRILRATWVHFKEIHMNENEKIQPEFFREYKNSGHGIFNIICQHTPTFEWFNFWMQVSHIAVDGRTAARFQFILKSSFLSAQDQTQLFPNSYMHLNKKYSVFDDTNNVYSAVQIADTESLIKIHKEIERSLGKISLVGIILWALAHTKSFKDIKFNIPVDLPERGIQKRTVGFVFVNPSKYIQLPNKIEAFCLLNSFILQQTADLVKRKGVSYYFLETATLLPLPIAKLLFKVMPESLSHYSGSTCLALIQSTELAIPTLSDNINTAITISFPSENKNSIASVGIRTRCKNGEMNLTDFQFAINQVQSFLPNFN